VPISFIAIPSHPPPLAALGVEDGEIVFPLPWHFVARFDQAVHDVVPRLYSPTGNPRMHQLVGHRPWVALAFLFVVTPRMQLDVALPRGIEGVHESVFLNGDFPPRLEILLPVGRGDVERLEVDPVF
jgi:hypothetical protein